MSVQALLVAYKSLGPASRTNTAATFTTDKTSPVSLAAISVGSNTNRKALCFGICVMGRTITSMTFDGIAATELIETATSTGNAIGLAIYSLPNASLPDPTVTDIDIEVTLSGTSGARPTYAMYAVYSSTTAIDTTAQSATTNSANTAVTTNQDCTASGVIIAMGAQSQSGSDPISASWTNLTEDSDFTAGAGERVVFSSASLTFSTTQTGLACTMTPTGPANSEAACMVSVSYGPG